jgi:hypothetical protein
MSEVEEEGADVETADKLSVSVSASSSSPPSPQTVDEDEETADKLPVSAPSSSPPQTVDDDEETSDKLPVSASPPPTQTMDEDEDWEAQFANRENFFYKSLSEGFRALQDIRENKKKPLFAFDTAVVPKEEPNEEGQKKVVHATSSPTSSNTPKRPFVTCATVNFIDPTTKGSAPAPTKTNMLSKANATTPKLIEDVYEKLTSIFERDYGSTLRTIPYKSIRGGGNEIISSLPVRAVLTRSHGARVVNGNEANVPWGGTAGTAAAPVNEPSEWHNAPFCHVYIAACESLQHYQAKVRPSLQAFVSQIEAAETNAHPSSGSSGGRGGNSAHFLIVYVPTGLKSATGESEGSGTTGRVGTALASRIQKARQRIANATSREEMSNDSIHSTDTFDSKDGASDDDLDSGLVAVNLMTKTEREVYNQIIKDFPNSKTVIMSMTSLGTSDDVVVADETVATKTQEWNSFNKHLGSVIVNGFRDRCRRYTEELRRLDSQRAAKPTTNEEAGDRKDKKHGNIVEFNLAYFFLVKESLAFTFEQMQLPAEALLQYDEFRVYLPDVGREMKEKLRASKAPKFKYVDGPPLVELADAADHVAFRRRIRSETDLVPVADVVRRYLFARELCILFVMEHPVELISRCQAFIKTEYSMLLRGLSDLNKKEQQSRMVEAAKWVVEFSWDVKCASDSFFTGLDPKEQEKISDNASVDTPASNFFNAESESQEQSEQYVARKLSEVLETARLFLMQLGDTELQGDNPLRRYEKGLPRDVLEPWQPWQPVHSPEDADADAKVVKPFTGANVPYKTERSSLLEDAFLSAEMFEAKYLELTSCVVTLSRFSGRHRIASRLQGEMAEYYIRKGDLKHAAAIIMSIVKMCRWDQWDRCHFWRLFRLAYCQRTTAKSTDYLKTLVCCFSPRTAAVAPSKALIALQEDLQLVISDSRVGEARYGKLAFLETRIGMLETSSDESSMGTGIDRKQLLKRYCSVGENVHIVITITSHLPRSIELDSLKLFVVSFAKFSSIVENRESVEEEDAFRILSYDSHVEVKPGENTFSFDWVPMIAGQYILSSVELKWKEGFFYYDSMELADPLLGVDVLPSDPTHSIALDPAYLIPGHDQQVRITFDSGSDFVTEGKLRLDCSAGIQLIPPGEDPAGGNWQSHCDVELSACQPGEKIELSTFIRCSLREGLPRSRNDTDSSQGAIQGLSAKAFTKYLHSSFDSSFDEKNDSKSPHMKTVLETVAPILEKSALTVASADAMWYPSGDRAMVSVSLLCNTPHTFSVDEWNLFLPAPLQVAEGGDLNGDLLKCSVSQGDQLAFAFECEVRVRQESKASDVPILHVKLRDNIGKVFTLEIPLDLDELYARAWEEDVTASATMSLTAELRVGSLEGNVGEPVGMTFVMDTSGLAEQSANDDQIERLLYYSVAWEASDWVMGGKVEGALKCTESKEVSCDVIGIPTVPGLLSHFPKLNLAYESTDGTLKPVMVKSQHPIAFKSKAHLHQTAVACTNTNS